MGGVSGCGSFVSRAHIVVVRVDTMWVVKPGSIIWWMVWDGRWLDDDGGGCCLVGGGVTNESTLRTMKIF